MLQAFNAVLQQKDTELMLCLGRTSSCKRSCLGYLLAPLAALGINNVLDSTLMLVCEMSVGG